MKNVFNRQRRRAHAASWIRAAEHLEQRQLFSTVSVAGLWNGTATQGSGSFTYQLNLTQSGQAVNGTERISETSQPQYYGLLAVSGSVVGSTFSYSDTKVISQNTAGFSWILKNVALQIAPNDSSMQGPWSGGGSSGQISVTRVPSINLTPPVAQTAVAGVSKSFSLGSFTESDATGPFGIDVNWGDGSKDSLFTTSAVGSISAKPHTYAKAGVDTVTVIVTDAQSHKSNTATFRVTVSEATASIAGNVFKDLNANGVLNPGETGLGGARVYLDGNKNGKFDATELMAITDASGNYTFSNLVAGTYRVSEVVPSGYKLIAPLSGYMDETLATGKAIVGVNFADAPATGSISGLVFNDANVNQKFDATELGLDGWQVYIDVNKDGKYDAGDVLSTTDINGSWSFTGLIAGTYAVRVAQVSKTATTTAGGVLQTITLAGGQAVVGKLFGEVRIA